MKRDRCDYLIPRYVRELHADEGDSIACLLPKGHSGDHLCRLVSGEYVEWRDNPVSIKEYLRFCQTDEERALELEGLQDDDLEAITFYRVEESYALGRIASADTDKTSF